MTKKNIREKLKELNWLENRQIEELLEIENKEEFLARLNDAFDVAVSEGDFEIIYYDESWDYLRNKYSINTILRMAVEKNCPNIEALASEESADDACEEFLKLEKEIEKLL